MKMTAHSYFICHFIVVFLYIFAQFYPTVHEVPEEVC